jgi:hypothetical protein
MLGIGIPNEVGNLPLLSGKHAHADHSAYAAFWHGPSPQLDVVAISRGTLGVVACFGVIL